MPAGSVFFGAFAGVGNLRMALLYAGMVFLPAAALALVLPQARAAIGEAAAAD